MQHYFYSAASEREVERVHGLILANGGFAPGMRVVDVGAGRGLLTAPIARILGPSGRVYATDVERQAIATLRELAARRAPDAAPIEVRPVSDPFSTALDDLPARSIHRMLMVNVFEFADPDRQRRVVPQFRAFGRLLRDDGEIIYHQDWCATAHDRADVIRIFAEAGIELRGEIDLGAVGIPARAAVFGQGFDAQPRFIERGFLLRFGPRR